MRAEEGGKATASSSREPITIPDSPGSAVTVITISDDEDDEAFNTLAEAQKQ